MGHVRCVISVAEQLQDKDALCRKYSFKFQPHTLHCILKRLKFHDRVYILFGAHTRAKYTFGTANVFEAPLLRVQCTNSPFLATVHSSYESTAGFDDEGTCTCNTGNGCLGRQSRVTRPFSEVH